MTDDNTDHEFIAVIRESLIADGTRLFERLYARVQTDDDNTLSHAQLVQCHQLMNALIDDDLPLALEHATVLVALMTPPETP